MITRVGNRVKTEISRGLVTIRGNLQIYGKLDYTKHKLLVYNMIRANSCTKEPETVEWIEGFEKNDVVYDVGANIGAYSLIMSKYAEEVYSFEPAVFNFSILTKNIIENVKKGLIENNIIPMNIALSSKTNIGEFNYGSLEDGTSIHMFGSKINQHGKTFEPELSQKILAVSIDDLIDVFGALVPTHLKIDVDGNELDVLNGAKKTLKNKKLKSILVEITFSKKGEETRKFIEDNGFELLEKSKRSMDFANHIFIR